MIKPENYEDFQNLIFDELESLEREANRPTAKIVVKFSEEDVENAAVRGIRLPREMTFSVPEECLARIEPDRRRWPEVAARALSSGISRRWSQIQRRKERKE